MNKLTMKRRGAPPAIEPIESNVHNLLEPRAAPAPMAPKYSVPNSGNMGMRRRALERVRK